MRSQVHRYIRFSDSSLDSSAKEVLWTSGSLQSHSPPVRAFWPHWRFRIPPCSMNNLFPRQGNFKSQQTGWLSIKATIPLVVLNCSTFSKWIFNWNPLLYTAVLVTVPWQPAQFLCLLLIRALLLSIFQKIEVWTWTHGWSNPTGRSYDTSHLLPKHRLSSRSPGHWWPCPPVYFSGTMASLPVKPPLLQLGLPLEKHAPLVWCSGFSWLGQLSSEEGMSHKELDSTNTKCVQK